MLAALGALQLCVALPAGTATARAPRLSSFEAQAIPATSDWGTAEEVPGTATLNAGGNAAVNSVSCTAAGECSAGGVYEDASTHLQAFVVDEVDGTWRRAEEVPGTASRNAGGDAEVYSVSCTAPGQCAAGGLYEDSSSHEEAFVVDEVHGIWDAAEEVPGTATLNAGGNAAVNSVSCTSEGDCSAGGVYEDASGHREAFVVAELDGNWGQAEEVPGTSTLNAGGSAAVYSLSCAATGQCAAGGIYEDGSSFDEAFVVAELDGNWGQAEEVPGTSTLNAGGSAAVYSLSCTPGGNCAAGGYYEDASSHDQSFVVDEVDGTWRPAEEIPATASLNAGGSASVSSVSCTSPGDCSAGGYYADASNNLQAFIVRELDGTWTGAEEVPGSAKLNAGGNAYVNAVSCPSAGNCAAAGGYWSSFLVLQAFVVNELDGSWGTAEEVPGTATLNAGGNAEVDAVSCSSASSCGGGGVYADSSGGDQAFVAGYAPPPTVSRLLRRKGPESGGTVVTVTGRNLLAPTAVHFGTTAAVIEKVVSARQIEVISPRGTGSVIVTVTTAEGTSAKTSAAVFRYVPRPEVTRLSPSRGRRSGGTIVTIVGKHLLAATAVHFGTKVASIHKIVSASRIEVISPKGSGTVAVRVTTAGGTSPKTAADHFSY